MMKKRWIATLAAGVILVSAAWVSAAPMGPMGGGPGAGGERPCLFNNATWTDAQKAEFQQDMAAHHEKMLALKKDFLNQEVAKGLISREQADQHLQFMQDRMEWMKAHPGEMGKHYRGMMNGAGRWNMPCQTAPGGTQNQ